uniref:IP18755p n=1 Tax=Drosophila melanogaster TaxID=7227 RepID=A2VEY6_DROME|nr:IP18755p [Drosophila melanogaster]
MEYSIFIFLALTCVLFMGQSCLAAPSADDLAKFGEMERSIKELTSSIGHEWSYYRL